MNSLLKPEFEGTWRFANEKEAEGWNYLNFSKGNRVAQFFNIKDGNFECGKMLVADIGNETIEFFPEDGSEGWTRKYRFDEGNLVIIEGDKEYPCSRLPEMVPWLVQGIFDSESYFDENEANWGKKD